LTENGQQQNNDINPLIR